MRRVEVTMHSEEGQWWAESRDVPHFTAAADSLAELRALATEGLSFYLEVPNVELVESVVFDDSRELSFFQQNSRLNAWYVPKVTTGIGTSLSRTGAGMPIRELKPAF